MDDYSRFQYLNVDAVWPAFQLHNLEIGADGSLSLARVPRLLAPIGVPADPTQSASSSAGVSISGIAVTGVGDDDCDCTTFVSDPAQHRVWRIDGCTGEPTLTSMHGPGSGVGEVNQPLGLAAGPSPVGWRLYV